MEVSLVMFKADGTRRDFPVRKAKVTIGRTNTCDLRIPLSSVSRRHCEVELNETQVRLRDLGSSNGTYHNSIRIQEASLRAGDEVVVGPVVFTVVIDGQPSEIKPVRTILGGNEVDSASSASVSAMPQPIAAHDEHLPQVEAEGHSPTVDLDDPIAALEAMAQAEKEGSSEFPTLISDDEDHR
jgi:pSer/pThr/pTyr-binding forkhead associated (FHA) protein